MKLNIFNKLKHLVKDSKKLYIITSSTAYKELKLNGVLSNKIYCCIFVGEYFDSKSNKSLSNFTLPLSSIRFRPYSLKAKIQVLYCDFLQLIICLLFKLLKGKNIEIIFTSIMNSRSLYILDSFIKNIKVIEWQYKFIYKYLKNYYQNQKIHFKYGDFVFRANNKLTCEIVYPLSLNDKFNELIEYDIKGNVLIIHNPNRDISYWHSINNIIENNKLSNLIFFLIIHPKTFEEDKKDLKRIFSGNKNFHNIIFSSLSGIMEQNEKIKLSLCYSLSSSLDFILYDNSIPIVSPLKFI